MTDRHLTTPPEAASAAQSDREVTAGYALDGVCVVCRQPIRVMAFKGTGTCSVDCAKTDNDDKNGTA